MGTGKSGDDWSARRIYRSGQNQVFLREFLQSSGALQPGRAPVSSQLYASDVRRVFARGSCAVHLGQLQIVGGDFHDGGIFRGVSRGEFSVQASGRVQTVLRDVRRV